MPYKAALLVCYGTICRSPMAEGFLHKSLDKTDKPVEVKVVSAGLNTY